MFHNENDSIVSHAYTVWLVREDLNWNGKNLKSKKRIFTFMLWPRDVARVKLLHCMCTLWICKRYITVQFCLEFHLFGNFIFSFHFILMIVFSHTFSQLFSSPNSLPLSPSHSLPPSLLLFPSLSLALFILFPLFPLLYFSSSSSVSRIYCTTNNRNSLIAVNKTLSSHKIRIVDLFRYVFWFHKLM